MSQKKAGRHRPQPRAARPKRHFKIGLCLIFVLALSGVMLARLGKLPIVSSAVAPVLSPTPTASPTPNPFSPKRAAKEYIYVGGRMQAIEETKPPAGGTAFDISGDGHGDIVVYRPGDGNWYVLDISTEPATSTLQQLGSGNETLVPGDYDGDGKTDIAVWKPNTGTCSDNHCGWQIKLSTDSLTTHYYEDWGVTGDIAVPADYDGDGKMDRAVWRPSTGQWYILNSSYGSNPNTPEQTVIGWGDPTDKPVPADYDGDGKADAAVFRPSTGNWYIKNSSNGTTSAVGWGVSTDWLAPADYDGDGKADLAVFRPSEGNWYIRQSSSNATKLVSLGQTADLPVPADYDGDGRVDIAIWRPSTGNWYIRKSSDGATLLRNWGDPTDKPVPSAYVRQ